MNPWWKLWAGYLLLYGIVMAAAWPLPLLNYFVVLGTTALLVLINLDN